MGLAFQNGSAILRITMTDNFNYQDVFKTNIPTFERDIALHTKHLLAAVHDQQFNDLIVFRHLARNLGSANMYQAFWELKGEDGRVQRSLAITATSGSFVLGLDRRPTHDQPDAYRKSLHGWKYVFDSNPHSESFNGSGSDEEVQLFYDTFYDTVASLGLQHHLQEVLESQKESDLAIFAKAA